MLRIVRIVLKRIDSMVWYGMVWYGIIKIVLVSEVKKVYRIKKIEGV